MNELERETLIEADDDWLALAHLQGVTLRVLGPGPEAERKRVMARTLHILINAGWLQMGAPDTSGGFDVWPGGPDDWLARIEELLGRQDPDDWLYAAWGLITPAGLEALSSERNST